MAFVNRLFGGTRAVKLFVAEQARIQPAGQPLRVLDMGSGICDIPIAVCRWAKCLGIDVRFTCLDLSPHTPTIARELIQRAGLVGTIEVVREDIFTHRPAQPYDCAVGSMFFHHLKEDEILRMISHIRGFVRRSVLVNDLGRNWPDYIGAWFLTLPLRWEVRHDGLLSIRRSFKPHELVELLQELPNVTVQASNAWLFRVKAVIRFREAGVA